MSDRPASPPPDDHRERLITWRDPAATLAAARSLSGLEYIRGYLTGEFPMPPMAELMGLTGEEVEHGRVVFGGDPGEHHLNPVGTVHGGFAATLLDSAMGCAVHTTLAPGEAFTTVDLAITFVRPIAQDGGSVLSEGTVIHRGRTIATAEGRLTRKSDGRLVAHGTTTCLVLSAAP